MSGWTREMDDIEPSRLSSGPCGDCWWRMVHAVPAKPFQRCSNGHLLPWLDADRDEERGYRDGDDDGSKDTAA